MTDVNKLWEWGKKNILPLAVMATGNANIMSGYQQGAAQLQARQEAENEAAWNKLEREARMKQIQRQNEELERQFMEMTPEMAGQFKGTTYEPFYWTPEQTVTNKVELPNTIAGTNTNVPGEITTKIDKQFIPQKILKQDYTGMIQGLQTAKQNALEEAEKKRQFNEEMAYKWATLGTKSPPKSPLMKNIESEYAKYAAINKGIAQKDPYTGEIVGWQYPSGVQALDLETWVRQNKPATTYAAFTKETGGYEPEFKQPTGYLSKNLQKLSKGQGFGQTDALQADEYIAKQGGVRRGIMEALDDNSVSESMLRAMVARFNYNNKTSWTLEDWIDAKESGRPVPTKLIPSKDGKDKKTIVASNK
jgi:hypothetical protein